MTRTPQNLAEWGASQLRGKTIPRADLRIEDTANEGIDLKVITHIPTGMMMLAIPQNYNGDEELMIKSVCAIFLDRMR